MYIAHEKDADYDFWKASLLICRIYITDENARFKMNIIHPKNRNFITLELSKP